MKTAGWFLALAPTWLVLVPACEDGPDETPHAAGGQAARGGQAATADAGARAQSGADSGEGGAGLAPSASSSSGRGGSPFPSGTGGRTHASAGDSSGGDSGSSGDDSGSSGDDGGLQSGGDSSLQSGGSNHGGGRSVGGAGARDPGLPSEGAKAIAVGRRHSCAITSRGAVRCWGNSDSGQLGNGIQDATPTGVFAAPVQVHGLDSGVTSLASFGDHTCVVAATRVQCWGANGQGQLGNSQRTDSAIPVDVTGLTSGVKAVAVGGEHSCALSHTGAVQCWGKNDRGQLGHASSVQYAATPVVVAGLSPEAIAISAGQAHACVLTSAGAAQCWGSNLYGELGVGASGNVARAPVDIPIPARLSSIVAGDHVTCAITNAGALWCWGKNVNGQVGNGKAGIQEQEVNPVMVSGITAGASAVSSGDSFTCAVVSGAAKCWGSNFYLVLGNGQDASYESAIPIPVAGLSAGVISVAASAPDHACALSSDGAVRCWGSAGGALGNGTTDDAPTPVKVLGFP